MIQKTPMMMKSLDRIAHNIDAFKRALVEAHCPDGWKTIEEYDDILAALNGRLKQVILTGHANGRPRKWLTDEQVAAARAETRRRYRQRQKLRKSWEVETK